MGTDNADKRQQDFDAGLTRGSDGQVRSGYDAQQDEAERKRNEAQAKRDEERQSAQSAVDTGQNTRITSAAARLDKLDSFVLKPGEPMPAPTAADPSPRQRLRIHVPEVRTTVSLGGAALADARRGEDKGAPSYPGFGVHTQGHIFMTASKSPGESTATLQAKGDIVVQSEAGKLWTGSNGDALHASQNNAMLVGGGGVVIAGGSAVTWAANPEPDGTSPKPPGWMGGFGQSGSAISRVWSGIDAAVALGTGVRSALSIGLTRKLSWGDGVAVANLMMGNAGGAIVSGLGAANADPIGGTVIHGTGGVIVGSTHTMGLYSLTGTTVASVLGVSILAPAVGILGFAEVAIDSKKKVEIKSGSELGLIAKSKMEVAVRKGPFTLGAESITIGDVSAQDFTKAIGLAAKDALSGTAAEVKFTSGSSQLGLTKESAWLQAKKSVVVSSKGMVSLVGKKVALTAKDYLRMGCGEQFIGISKKSLVLSSGGGEPPENPIKDAAQQDELDRLRQFKAKGWRTDPKKDAALAAYDSYVQALESWKENPEVRLALKNSTIEIGVQGMKFKIDSGKVKSGALSWQKE